MDHTYRMGLAKGRLADAHAVYRHRARLVAEDFAEIRHLWQDRRGKWFSDRHIAPQLTTMDDAQFHLQEQVGAAAAALQLTSAAEDRVRQCQAALTDFESDARETIRLKAATIDFAGRVALEAGAIRAEAERINAVISTLLT